MISKIDLDQNLTWISSLMVKNESAITRIKEKYSLIIKYDLCIYFDYQI